MPDKARIALDAMGGDHGPSVVLPGADISLTRHPNIEFRLYGDRAVMEPIVEGLPRLKANAKLVHTDVSIRMDDKPSQALRRGRWKSSMWLAIDAVKKCEADVSISAGNTGALMAMARFNLKTIKGIERPAIAALWPTLKGESVVLDVGASIGADEEHLINLAAMGSAMARVLFDIERPTVGLLNVGVEEIKGLEAVREAGQRLREGNFPYFDYIGFVEGDDIGKGAADVVVTEGFAGNIALKTAEGTARQFAQYLKDAMARTLAARLGYLLARHAFRTLREKMDPRKANGGVFLGLNGIVIKSHGGADAEGFAAAVDMGHDMFRYGLLGKIGESMAREMQASPTARVASGAAP
jgi:glycerol-3-phosphate acyltransferase PlsX